MVGNEMSLSTPVSRRKLSSASTASISVSLPCGASRSNQARKRVIAAPSRLCAARAPAISAWFFIAFISAIGSEPRAGLPPPSRHNAGERVGRARLVEPHGLALERAEIAREVASGARTSAISSSAWRTSLPSLPRVDIERRPALARNEREGERQRRMRDVGAADVERPGDVLRVGHHQRVGAQLGDLAAHALELVGRAFAGEFQLAQAHRLAGGGAGRSVHSASIGFSSTATNSAPAAAQALRSLSALSAVCSQGS